MCGSVGDFLDCVMFDLNIDFLFGSFSNSIRLALLCAFVKYRT